MTFYVFISSNADGSTGIATQDRQNLLYQQSLERCERLLATDPEVQMAQYDPKCVAYVQEQCNSSIEAVEAIMRFYADRPAFAWSLPPPHPVNFQKLTYRETWTRIQAFASGLVCAGLVTRGEFVGLCGFTSLDYVIADFAALYLGLVSVPLPTSIASKDLAQIIHEAEITCLIGGVEQLSNLMSVVKHCPTVRGFVLMDTDMLEQVMTLEQCKQKFSRNVPPELKFYVMEELQDLGRLKGNVPYAVPDQDGHLSNPIVNLMYTSGSTGE